MSGIFAAYDSFLFKIFDFGGRSSRTDFWAVMPVLWLAMAGLLIMDFNMIWADLKAREIPPLNPFAYGFVLFYLVTFIPRLSLTIRRLHDSGKRGKWAFAPFTALILLAYLLLGLGSALMTTNEVAMGAGLSVVALISMGSPELVWEAMFAIAAHSNQIDWSSLSGALTAGLQTPNLDNVVGGVAQQPEMAVPALLMICILVFGPMISMSLYFLFLIMPSSLDENAYGVPPGSNRRASAKAKGEHNAFASYALLTKQGHVPTEEEIAARKAEIHSLYQQRVLGRPQG